MQIYYGMNKTECQGCIELSSISLCGSRIPSEFVYKGERMECPCRKCLVKGVCVDICNSFHFYYKMYSKLKLSKNLERVGNNE